MLTCKLSSSKIFLGSGLVRQSPDLEPLSHSIKMFMALPAPPWSSCLNVFLSESHEMGWYSAKATLMSLSDTLTSLWLRNWGVPLDQSCAILLKQPLHLHLTLLHWTFLQVMSLCCPYYFKWCVCFVFWDLLREFKLLEGCWYSMWWSSCVAAKS